MVERICFYPLPVAYLYPMIIIVVANNMSNPRICNALAVGL